MPNGLDKHSHNIHEQATKVIEAVETLKEKQKSEKKRGKTLIIIIVYIIFVCIVIIIMRVFISNQTQAVYTQTQYVNSITQESQDICNGVLESIEASLIPQDNTSYIYDETIKNRSFQFD